MSVETDWQVDQESQEELGWRVVVLDDPVNTMNFVVYVFRRVLSIPPEQANELMLAVHETGSAQVWSGARDEAEKIAEQLSSYQLWARAEES